MPDKSYGALDSAYVQQTLTSVHRQTTYFLCKACVNLPVNPHFSLLKIGRQVNEDHPTTMSEQCEDSIALNHAAPHSSTLQDQPLPGWQREDAVIA